MGVLYVSNQLVKGKHIIILDALEILSSHQILLANFVVWTA